MARKREHGGRLAGPGIIPIQLGLILLLQNTAKHSPKRQQKASFILEAYCFQAEQSFELLRKFGLRGNRIRAYIRAGAGVVYYPIVLIVFQIP